ncbi:MAG: phenylalanine--tRNA ligase subunit beta [Gammaproteobacteria bacterium]
MRISEQWLREWANPRLTLAELTQQLTMTGLEVEGVEPAAPEFSGVVVGLVTALAPHPEAERLRVATVDIGRGESLRIVCGAPNAKVGMRAPVALPGASLLGAVKIATTTLRGVQSQGMLCSAKELGLGEDGDGLLELPSTMTVGDDLRAALALDDQVFTVSPTPNRGDCLSIAGVAREVSVIGNCPLTPVATDPVTPLSAAQLEVTLADPADCPRYVGCVIRDLDPTAQTPLWLRERLRRAGLRSLGPLVDVTNYVMLELGQPLHAFDLDKLEGGITVRRAREGEILVLLNDQRIALAPDTLLITDASGPVALAGIMGGAATAVGDVLAMYFWKARFPREHRGPRAPLWVADRRLAALRAAASIRLQARAAEQATRLLMGIAGSKPGPLVDVLPIGTYRHQSRLRCVRTVSAGCSAWTSSPSR